MDFENIIQNILIQLNGGEKTTDGTHVLGFKNTQTKSQAQSPREYYSLIEQSQPRIKDMSIEDSYVIFGWMEIVSGEIAAGCLECFYSKGKISSTNSILAYSRLDIHFKDNGFPLSHQQPHLHMVDGEIYRPGFFKPHISPVISFVIETLRSTFDYDWFIWAATDNWNDRQINQPQKTLYANKFEQLASKSESFFDEYNSKNGFDIAFESLKNDLRATISSYSYAPVNSQLDLINNWWL